MTPTSDEQPKPTIILHKPDIQSKPDPKSKSYNQYIEDGIKVRLEKAQAYVKTGNLIAAKNEYKRIIFLDPNNRTGLVQLGEISSDLGDYATAILYYKRAQRLAQDHRLEERIYQLMLKKGKQMVDNKDFDPYMQICKSRPSNDPLSQDATPTSSSIKDILVHAEGEAFDTDSQNLFIRALAYLSENQKHKAIQELDNCTKLDPKNIYAYILKGKVYWSINQTNDGNREFWLAQAINAEHPEVKEFIRIIAEKSAQSHKLAVRFYFEHDLHKAVFYITKALELDPKNITFLLFRSFVYRKKREYERALQDIEQASQYVPQEDVQQNQQLSHQLSITYNDMGISMMELNKFDDAIVIFNEAIKFKDDDWGITVNRGDCFRQLKQWENAVNDYQQALEIIGPRKEINQRISFCLHREALNAFNKRQYRDCIEILEGALRFDPGNTEYQALKGKCFLFENDTKNAYKSYKNALNADPSNLDVTMALSQLTMSSPTLPRLSKAQSPLLARTSSSSRPRLTMTMSQSHSQS